MVWSTVVEFSAHGARDRYPPRPTRPMPSGSAQAANSLTSCWSDPWDQALFCHGRGGVLRHRGSLPGASHCDPHRECGAGGAGTLPGVSGPGHLLQPSWTWDCPRQFLGSVGGAGGEGWLSRGCPGQSLLQSAVSCCKHRSGSLQASIVQVGESAAQSLTSLASCLGAVSQVPLQQSGLQWLGHYHTGGGLCPAVSGQPVNSGRLQAWLGDWTFLVDW